MYLYNLAKGLVERGHSITVFAPSDAYIVRRLGALRNIKIVYNFISERQKGGKYKQNILHWLPASLKLIAGNLREYRYLKHLFLENHVDLLHVNISGYEIAGVSAKHADIPVIGMMCILPHHDQDIIRKAFTIYTARYYDVVLSKSKFAIDEWIRFAGLNPERCLYIWNGVDLEYFRPWWEFRNFREDEFTVISAGRLELGKGHEKAVELMNLLRNRKDIKLLIVGDGSKEYELRRMVEQMGLEEKCSLLGYIDNMPSVFVKSDCFICLSQSESFGQVVIEAMAAGLPVIASDTGTFRELIRDGETGFIVKGDNLLDAARIIVMLAYDRDLYMKISRSAREYVEKNFSLEKMVDNHLRIYQKILEEK